MKIAFRVSLKNLLLTLCVWFFGSLHFHIRKSFRSRPPPQTNVSSFTHSSAFFSNKFMKTIA